MALSFFIQEGVVSTTTKKTGLAQLFNVTAWLKFALTSLGVAYYDPCEPTCLPTTPAVMPSWADSTSRPTGLTSGIAYIGLNKDTSNLEYTVDGGTTWNVVAIN